MRHLAEKNVLTDQTYKERSAIYYGNMLSSLVLRAPASASLAARHTLAAASSRPLGSRGVAVDSRSFASKSDAEAPPTSSFSLKEKSKTFAWLLRNCTMTQMGDPEGKVLVGRIYHTVGDDLYIDYGGKFPCVCQRPHNHRQRFVRGDHVRVLIKRQEVSQKFLGFDREMTLLESEATMLGLHKPER